MSIHDRLAASRDRAFTRSLTSRMSTVADRRPVYPRQDRRAKAGRSTISTLLTTLIAFLNKEERMLHLDFGKARQRQFLAEAEQERASSGRTAGRRRASQAHLFQGWGHLKAGVAKLLIGLGQRLGTEEVEPIQDLAPKEVS
jgi:predicted transposase YdaD